MTEFIPQADFVASLLLTYLIHSTVIVLLIGVVLLKGNSDSKRTPRLLCTAIATVVIAAAVTAVSFAPRAVADS